MSVACKKMPILEVLAAAVLFPQNPGDYPYAVIVLRNIRTHSHVICMIPDHTRFWIECKRIVQNIAPRRVTIFDSTIHQSHKALPANAPHLPMQRIKGPVATALVPALLEHIQTLDAVGTQAADKSAQA